MNIRTAAFITVFLVFHSAVFAHPTGNMITIGEAVLWSYINPVNDPEHHACVMIWKKDTEPKVLIQSEFAASDYMLYSNQNDVYIVERKFLPATDAFEIRLLKFKFETKPTVIWDWFKAEHRIGEGGFFMLSDNRMVFGDYPDIYSLEKGKKPQKYFDFNHPIKRIREVENHQILLLGDSSIYLVQQNGRILKQWHELIDNSVADAPLNRNQIFDADYSNGALLLAYWGKRSFELITPGGNRQTIVKQSEPLTPHWVVFWNNEKLLFSSKLIFDGSTPEPHLTLLTDQNNEKVIWSIQ